MSSKNISKPLKKSKKKTVLPSLEYGVVNWVGNKKPIVHRLIAMLPPYVRSNSRPYTYVEPFVGGGAMLMNLKPKKAVIGDLNFNSINLFQSIKSHSDEMIARVLQLQNSVSEGIAAADKNQINNIKETVFREVETEVNDKNNETKEISPRRAANYYWYTKHALYNFANFIKRDQKFRSTMAFTPSMWTKKWSVNRVKHLQRSHDILAAMNLKIMYADYKKTIRLAKKGDFVFFDPPYMQWKNFYIASCDTSRMSFHETLIRECVKLTKRGVFFLLTNGYDEDVKKQFENEGFKSKVILVTQPGRSEKRKELVFYNYKGNTVLSPTMK